MRETAMIRSIKSDIKYVTIFEEKFTVKIFSLILILVILPISPFEASFVFLVCIIRSPCLNILLPTLTSIFSHLHKAGKRVIRRVSTGVKLENSKKRSKTHQVPDEVISLKEKVATPLVEMANHALNGGYSSSDSSFVYLDKYREERLKNSDLSATTKKGDESRYNGIKQYQSLDKPISKITTEDLEGFISEFETQHGRKGENKSRKTVQQYKLIIEGTLKLAKKKGVIDENPAEALPSYKSQPEKISSDIGAYSAICRNSEFFHYTSSPD